MVRSPDSPEWSTTPNTSLPRVGGRLADQVQRAGRGRCGQPPTSRSASSPGTERIPRSSRWCWPTPQRRELESVEPFAGHFVVSERSALDGLEQLRSSLQGHRHRLTSIDHPEPVYSLTGGHNPEWVAYDVPVRLHLPRDPPSSDRIRRRTRQRTIVGRSRSVGGYDPARLPDRRLWARAPRRHQVPISLVAPGQFPTTVGPCLLYGYGAYEVTIDPSFSSPGSTCSSGASVFAIAHVRGGGELGREWYEEGRHAQKTTPSPTSSPGRAPGRSGYAIAGGWSSGVAAPAGC